MKDNYAVHHVDGNIFNNEKSNLRVTAISQNSKNRIDLNETLATGIVLTVYAIFVIIILIAGR